MGDAAVDEDDEPDNLETCCICLDSLCVSPVVALMADGRDGCKASCSHFFHGGCAARLEPRLCPMCRTPFGELSRPFGGDELVAAGATRVIAAARLLQGDEPEPPDEGSTVSARRVVELLAASFPIQQAALEAAVADLAVGESSLGGVVASPRSGTKRIGAPGLVQVLARCSSVGLLLHSPATAAAAESPEAAGAQWWAGQVAGEQPYSGYTLATRVSRRLRWLALKGAGASGTALFAGGCGAVLGIWFGAFLAIPRGSLWRPLSYVLDSPDPSFGLLAGGMYLVYKMLQHGMQRGDLLVRGVAVGGAVGVVLGGIGALAVVDPGDHGPLTVFLSGVRGRTLLTMWRKWWGAARGIGGSEPASRVDLFAPVGTCTDGRACRRDSAAAGLQVVG